MAIPDTMQAAVLMAPKRPQLQQVQTPVPGPVDVLIEVAACAVCSTDVALIDHPLPA
jgi:propanol-preferring alcohol dehydrogenase